MLKAGPSAPGVTVVIPCYNYGHYLREAVDAVLTQPGVDARVIIVDDCSPDGSAEVARALAAEDDRVTVIAHPENTGHIQTYNDGLAAVTTKYVTLVSADDLVAPGALGRAAAVMEADGRIGMVYGWPLEFSGDTPAPGRDARLPLTWTRWRGQEWIRLSCFRGRSFILSPEVVMRTDAVRELGGYNPELPHSGDLEYWLRTAAHWDIGRVNGRIQAYYRQHATNMHATTFAGMPADLRHRWKAFEYLASDEFAAVSAAGPRRLRRVRKAMAAEAARLAIRDLQVAGDESSALALREVADELGEGRIPGRLARRFNARLALGRRDKATGPLHTAHDRLLRAGNRARWRIWAMTGVS